MHLVGFSLWIISIFTTMYKCWVVILLLKHVQNTCYCENLCLFYFFSPRLLEIKLCLTVLGGLTVTTFWGWNVLKQRIASLGNRHIQGMFPAFACYIPDTTSCYQRDGLFACNGMPPPLPCSDILTLNLWRAPINIAMNNFKIQPTTFFNLNPFYF